RLEGPALERQRAAGSHGTEGGRGKKKTLVANLPQGFGDYEQADISTAREPKSSERAAAKSVANLPPAEICGRVSGAGHSPRVRGDREGRHAAHRKGDHVMRW